jgi:tetratricopeptide (TPR) repeat protein
MGESAFSKGVDLMTPIHTIPLCVAIYLALIAMGLYSLKKSYHDNETLSLSMGALYIGLFCYHVAQILSVMKDDMMNFPILVLVCMPVAALFAIFLSHFLSQSLTIDQLFAKGCCFDSRDYLKMAMENLRKQNYPQAIKAYGKLIEQRPEDHEIHMEIAEIYAGNLNDPRSAVKEYEQALSKAFYDHQKVDILNRMADIYIHRLDNPERAVALLREIERTCPYSVWAQRALEKASGLLNRPAVKGAAIRVA